jgi:hypothetical protein
MSLAFPHGKRFAFTVIDDTDVATVQNVAPVYALLERLGMRATKTVWTMPCTEGSRNFSTSQTLEEAEYRAFVVDLQRRGFEIASHGATMESSTRERTAAGLERFRAVFGAYPRVHANHAGNRENLYWGAARVDAPLLKRLLRTMSGTSYYQGEFEGSPYWWGDLCARSMTYVRNLTFAEINLLRVNPTMPYRAFQERLEALARRPGWFTTVGELLDWMHTQRRDDRLSPAEWRRMQWTWARDLFVRKARELYGRGATVVILDSFRPMLRGQKAAPVDEPGTAWSART